MRRWILAALAVMLLGCASGPDEPGPNDGSSLNFDIKATITLDDDGIDPAVTTVHAGDALEVVNRGTKDHGLTSDTIDTGTLQPNESTVVFVTFPEKIEVHDRADRSHTATIEVLPAG